MKIVIGGQIDKQKIADLTQSILEDQAEIEVMGDIEAAMAIKNGEADYYLGACNTGGGGALAMAIALLGMNNCATVSMPGTVKSEEEIAAEVANGKKAYGFTAQHIDTVLPIILKYITQ